MCGSSGKHSVLYLTEISLATLIQFVTQDFHNRMDRWIQKHCCSGKGLLLKKYVYFNGKKNTEKKKVMLLITTEAMLYMKQLECF